MADVSGRRPTSLRRKVCTMHMPLGRRYGLRIFCISAWKREDIERQTCHFLSWHCFGNWQSQWSVRLRRGVNLWHARLARWFVPALEWGPRFPRSCISSPTRVVSLLLARTLPVCLGQFLMGAHCIWTPWCSRQCDIIQGGSDIALTYKPAALGKHNFGRRRYAQHRTTMSRSKAVRLRAQGHNSWWSSPM